MERITHAKLIELLRYDPTTGQFYWRKKRGRHQTATDVPAGTLHRSGYVYIRTCGRNYTAHRLALFYSSGEWPCEQVDHANGNRSDNRLCNLRLATRAQNLRNIKRKITNKSGVKGVHWCKPANKWRASIVIDGKNIHLGLFTCKDEAGKAYSAAAIKFHGAFARHD
jgi:hypothetical protein